MRPDTEDATHGRVHAEPLTHRDDVTLETDGVGQSVVATVPFGRVPRYPVPLLPPKSGVGAGERDERGHLEDARAPGEGEVGLGPSLSLLAGFRSPRSTTRVHTGGDQTGSSTPVHPSPSVPVGPPQPFLSLVPTRSDSEQEVDGLPTLGPPPRPSGRTVHETRVSPNPVPGLPTPPVGSVPRDFTSPESCTVVEEVSSLGVLPSGDSGE